MVKRETNYERHRRLVDRCNVTNVAEILRSIHLFSTEVEVKTPYKPKHWSRL